MWEGLDQGVTMGHGHSVSFGALPSVTLNIWLWTHNAEAINLLVPPMNFKASSTPFFLPSKVASDLDALLMLWLNGHHS